MLKRIALISVLIVPAFLIAQETPKQTPPKHVYKLDYVLTELDGGKKTDSKDYTMLIDSTRTGRLRVGTRLPVLTNPGAQMTQMQFSYMDIGVTIEATATSLADASLGLRNRVEVSSVAMPAGEGEKNPVKPAPGQPIVRQMTGESEVTVSFNKPTTLFTLDEPNSKRSFQVQLTATQIR